VGKFFGLYYNIGLEMREELGIRCSKGGFIFSIPRYMLVNYKLSYAFMYRYPLIADITFPFDFNLHRVLGYSLS
jgi:hypothetical protein